MAAFSTLDHAALAFFVLSWLGYTLVVERTRASERSLNVLMKRHRRAWMDQMLTRENRIADTAINASLQNGTAFFASTSLFAIGGALALLRSTDEMLTLFAEMPLGLATSRLAWSSRCWGSR